MLLSVRLAQAEFQLDKCRFLSQRGGGWEGKGQRRGGVVAG